jgi:8-amino-7-oxononanoate synthase
VTPGLIAELTRGLETRNADGLKRIRRTLDSPQGPRVVVEGRELVAFASNDYLGLASHPDIIAAVRDGAARWGAGAGASHLVCGHFAPHELLEDELARFVRPSANARALTFSSGYLANIAILTALAGRSDAIFADRLNHACLNDGALLSRAQFVRYPHADMEALSRQLEASTARRKLIATDAVFSMDGDVAPLPRLLALAEEHDAWLVVDDAHGFGVLGEGQARERERGGRGTLAHFGIESERVVAMGTLGKAAGVAGAFVTAHPAVVETLVQTARSYIFTTAAPPFVAEALLASLAIVRSDHGRRAHLFALVGRFRERMRALPWDLRDSSTPIQPIVVGTNDAAVGLAAELMSRGFWVPAIRPPTVPHGTARLRVSLTAAHALADVDALVDELADLAPRCASAAQGSWMSR